MADRSSQASQQYTLTIGGRTFSGWMEVSVPDQDIVTGSYVPGGGKSEIVTVGLAKASGQYVLTKKYDHAEYSALSRLAGAEGSLAGAKVDLDGRIVNSYEPRTGVLKGVSRSGMDSKSGDSLMMMARFQADG